MLENDICLIKRCSEETLERYVCGGGEDGDFPPAADALSDEDTADSLCAGYCQLKGKQTGEKKSVIWENSRRRDKIDGGGFHSWPPSSSSSSASFLRARVR